MIQALDGDFWTSRGTQLHEGNGSYIISYFDDDDDDDDDDVDDGCGGGGGGGGGGDGDGDGDDEDDDDDDDDDIKAEMIPVIKWATETISRSFRKYLSSISGKHEIKEVQKNKNSHTGHYTHTYSRKH